MNLCRRYRLFISCSGSEGCSGGGQWARGIFHYKERERNFCRLFHWTGPHSPAVDSRRPCHHVPDMYEYFHGYQQTTPLQGVWKGEQFKSLPTPNPHHTEPPTHRTPTIISPDLEGSIIIICHVSDHPENDQSHVRYFHQILCIELCLSTLSCQLLPYTRIAPLALLVVNSCKLWHSRWCVTNVRHMKHP